MKDTLPHIEKHDWQSKSPLKTCMTIENDRSTIYQDCCKLCNNLFQVWLCKRKHSIVATRQSNNREFHEIPSFFFLVSNSVSEVQEDLSYDSYTRWQQWNPSNSLCCCRGWNNGSITLSLCCCRFVFFSIHSEMDVWELGQPKRCLCVAFETIPKINAPTL